MSSEPQNKILPFRHKTPMPLRWVCPPPCDNTTFTLWTDGKVYCSRCYSHHYRIAFTVDESGAA